MIMTYTYIKKSIASQFVTFNEPLNASEYNNIGITWDDYVNNLWVLLSTEQAAFHEQHLKASVIEVWNMQLNPPHRKTLEEAKQEKIQQIENYDNSDAVNGFTINGVNMWLDKATRTGLLLRITAEQSVGDQNTTLWFGTQSFEIPITQAFQMLYALEIYASQCYDRTAAHKAYVNTLQTIEEVEQYDYTVGYPDKLNF